MNIPQDISHFLCQRADIDIRLNQIDPNLYDQTRNYLDGSVTWLSPFVTHGIIGTVDIANAVLASYSTKDSYRLLFELAWREYFHRVWESKGNSIFSDLRHPCASDNTALPKAIVDASTGIDAIDHALTNLMSHGYIHNHARMWTAAMCCNMGDTHWLPAAKWMHYHLLDGDLASNTLSWQWVAGTFSNKRYIANQDNINKYSKTNQRNTFLDVPYEQLAEYNVPGELAETIHPLLPQTLPGQPITEIEDLSGTVALRSVWQLNASWRPDATHQILFIDSDLFQKWPMSQNRWQFILHWAHQIPNIRIFTGTVVQLRSALNNATVLRQPYKACEQWGNTTDDHQWLYSKPTKSYNSFFQFWKLVQNQRFAMDQS